MTLTFRAALFKNVLNVDRGELHERDMTTGVHVIQNIYCNGCQKEVGWCYVRTLSHTNYSEATKRLSRSEMAITHFSCGVRHVRSLCFCSFAGESSRQS